MPPRARPAGPLTHAEAREQIHYDPLTGICTWLVSKPRVTKGMRAGNPHKYKGYRCIIVCGKSMMEHVFIWFWMTGEWPDRLVDHRNRTRNDNRWDNLRLATHGQNQMNSARYGANRGVMKRVNASSGSISYRVRASNGTKRIELGNYFCEELALLVYSEHTAKVWGEFKHES